MSSKLETLRDQHERLRADYALALDRASDAARAAALIESQEFDQDAPSPRLQAARERARKLRAEALTLGQRLRVSIDVLERCEAYARLTGLA